MVPVWPPLSRQSSPSRLSSSSGATLSFSSRCRSPSHSRLPRRHTQRDQGLRHAQAVEGPQPGLGPGLRRVDDVGGRPGEPQQHRTLGGLQGDHLAPAEQLVQHQGDVELLTGVEVVVHPADQADSVLDRQLAPARMDRPDQLGTHLRDPTIAEGDVTAYAAADLLARLEHRHLHAGPGQGSRRQQTGEPGTDHRDPGTQDRGPALGRHERYGGHVRLRPGVRIRSRFRRQSASAVSSRN